MFCDFYTALIYFEIFTPYWVKMASLPLFEKIKVPKMAQKGITSFINMI
jgi:hypothetical protein